jgi:hypothetical protein
VKNNSTDFVRLEDFELNVRNEQVRKFEDIAKQVDKDENGREFIRVSYFRVGPEPYNRRYAAQASLQLLSPNARLPTTNKIILI